MIIYTALIGNYDNLFPAPSGYECYCYTDQDIKVKGWQMIKVEVEEDKKRQVQKHKILCPSTDSLWVDANIEMKEVETFLSLIPLNCEIATPRHRVRKHFFEECKAVVNYFKDHENIVEVQKNKYRAEGFPDNPALPETGILFRRSTEQIVKMCNLWYSEIMNHSKRDQLSFNYACWKTQTPYSLIPQEIITKHFTIHPHR